MKYVLGLVGDAGAGKDTFADMAKVWAWEVLGPEYSISKFSFAAPVYELAAVILGVTPEKLAERRTKEIKQWFWVTQEALERTANVWKRFGIDKYADFSYVWPQFEEVALAPMIDKCILNFYSGSESPIYPLYTSPRKMLEFVGTELGRALVDENLWLNIVVDRITATKADISIISDVRFDNEAALVRNFPGAQNSSILKVHAPNNIHAIQSTHASARGVAPEFIDDVVTNNFDGLENFRKNVNAFCDERILFI